LASVHQPTREFPHPPQTTTGGAPREQKSALLLDDRRNTRFLRQRSASPALRPLVLRPGRSGGTEGGYRTFLAARVARGASRGTQFHHRLVDATRSIAYNEAGSEAP